MAQVTGSFGQSAQSIARSASVLLPLGSVSLRSEKMILSGILIGRFFDLEFLFSGETIVYFGERKDLRSISTHGSSLKTTARRYTAAVGAQSSDRPSRVGMSKPVSCAVAGSLPVPNAINSPPAQTLLRSLFRKEVNKWFRMSTREITRDVCIVWLAVNG